MSNPATADALFEGRGLGVTAITAILNLNNEAFDFRHLKYPHYNRLIAPGLFRYPRDVTAPINWGADAKGLIQFGGMGTMWQHNTGNWHVRYKAGGNPVNDGDGDIVYTRRPSGPGEHYLILGVRGNRVTTLRSYTPGEAFLENLTEDVLNVLNIFKPADYIHLAEHRGAARVFLDRLKAADDAGQLKGLDKRDVEALIGKGYEKVNSVLQQLSPEDRKALESGNDGPRVLTIAKWVYAALGIAIAGVATAIAAVVVVIAYVMAHFGPPGWAGAAILLLAAATLLAVGYGVASLFILMSFVFFTLDGKEAMALLQEAPL